MFKYYVDHSNTLMEKVSKVVDSNSYTQDQMIYGLLELIVGGHYKEADYILNNNALHYEDSFNLYQMGRAPLFYKNNLEIFDYLIEKEIPLGISQILNFLFYRMKSEVTENNLILFNKIFNKYNDRLTELEISELIKKYINDIPLEILDRLLKKINLSKYIILLAHSLPENIERSRLELLISHYPKIKESNIYRNVMASKKYILAATLKDMGFSINTVEDLEYDENVKISNEFLNNFYKLIDNNDIASIDIYLKEAIETVAHYISDIIKHILDQIDVSNYKLEQMEIYNYILVELNKKIDKNKLESYLNSAVYTYIRNGDIERLEILKSLGFNLFYDKDYVKNCAIDSEDKNFLMYLYPDEDIDDIFEISKNSKINFNYEYTKLMKENPTSIGEASKTIFKYTVYVDWEKSELDINSTNEEWLMALLDNNNDSHKPVIKQIVENCDIDYSYFDKYIKRIVEYSLNIKPLKYLVENNSDWIAILEMIPSLFLNNLKEEEIKYLLKCGMNVKYFFYHSPNDDIFQEKYVERVEVLLIEKINYLISLGASPDVFPKPVMDIIEKFNLQKIMFIKEEDRSEQYKWETGICVNFSTMFSSFKISKNEEYQRRKFHKLNLNSDSEETIDKLNKILESELDFTSNRNKLLYMATKFNNKKIIKILLNNKKRKLSWKVMTDSCEEKNDFIVEYILSKKLYTDIVIIKNIEYLMHRVNNKILSEYIGSLKEIEVQRYNELLNYTVKYNKPIILQILLKRKEKLNQKAELITKIIQKKDKKMFNIFITKYKTIPKKLLTIDNFWLCFQSYEKNSLNILKMFFANGVGIKDIDSEMHDNMMKNVSYNGKLGIINFLLENNYDKFTKEELLLIEKKKFI